MASEPPSDDETENRFDRQLDRLAVDENGHAGQLAEPRRLRARDTTPYRTRNVTAAKPMNTAAWRLSVFQNTSMYPSDVEPERLDVVRQRRPAAEHDRGQDGENDQAAAVPGADVAAAASRRRVRSRFVHGGGFMFPMLS